MEICNRFFNKDMVKIFRGCILAALFFCPYLIKKSPGEVSGAFSLYIANGLVRAFEIIGQRLL